MSTAFGERILNLTAFIRHQFCMQQIFTKQWKPKSNFRNLHFTQYSVQPNEIRSWIRSSGNHHRTVSISLLLIQFIDCHFVSQCWLLAILGQFKEHLIFTAVCNYSQIPSSVLCDDIVEFLVVFRLQLYSTS